MSGEFVSFDEFEASPWFRELSNDGPTFAELAARLNANSVAFRWKDGHGSAMSICMSIPAFVTYVPGCDRSRTLFVAIEGYGMYPFSIEADADTHPTYVGEKLMSDRVNNTTVALTELINGVRRALANRIEGM